MPLEVEPPRSVVFKVWASDQLLQRLQHPLGPNSYLLIKNSRDGGPGIYVLPSPLSDSNAHESLRTTGVRLIQIVPLLLLSCETLGK